MKKQRIFSGVQPSGDLHIGNYLGAIKQFVELQENADAVFCIVDEHAITVPQIPKELRTKTLEIAMLYLAAGIDPKRSTMFIQSHVPAHAELGWILNTMTPLGELRRMTQFKEKAKVEKEHFYDIFAKYTEELLSAILRKEKYDALEVRGLELADLVMAQENFDEKKGAVMAGLLNYPTLMAADILLYQTDVVPVGEDQIQHIELTRSIAERFNNRFGETFTIPKAHLNKTTARIMGLDDPAKKMSKSAKSAYNYIAILESPDDIRKKFKAAVTDSETEVRFDANKKPAISNLLNIYHAFSGKPITDIEKMYEGKGYGNFKKDLAEVVVAGLAPIQARYHALAGDPGEALAILQKGAEKAESLAQKTLSDVKEKIGFILR